MNRKYDREFKLEAVRLAQELQPDVLVIAERHTGHKGQLGVLEAGLEWIVKWEAGPFLGREALERERERGPSRCLSGFRMQERGIPRHGYTVILEGREAGEVTSGGFAPFLKESIGLVYLPVDRTEAGTPLGVVIRGRELAAEVVPTPFYRRKRKKRRKKA